MTPIPSNEERNRDAKAEFGSVADELEHESTKLRELASKVKAREESLSEMVANYPYFREFVYAKLREEFARELDELPDKDLEIYAKEVGAQPLEAFVHELE